MARNTSSWVSITIISLLVVALASTLFAWKRDHSHLTKHGARPKEGRTEMPDQNSVLQTQKAKSDLVISQLKASLDDQTKSVGDLTSQLQLAQSNLTINKNNYAFLATQINDIRARADKANADDSRDYQLYTLWKETAVNTREYLHGLYADDLSLRQAAKQGPYAPFTFANPESVMKQEPVPSPTPNHPPKKKHNASSKVEPSASAP